MWVCVLQFDVTLSLSVLCGSVDAREEEFFGKKKSQLHTWKAGAEEDGE